MLIANPLTLNFFLKEKDLLTWKNIGNKNVVLYVEDGDTNISFRIISFYVLSQTNRISFFIAT
jgi:hypothetical protein